MRFLSAISAVFAATVGLCGCAGNVQDEPSGADEPASLALQGALGDGSCVDGSVNVQLDRTADGNYAGEAYYQSQDVFGGVYRATYDLTGTLREGRLKIDETRVVEADDLPEFHSWCTGTMTLAPDAAGGWKGDYVSGACGCRGTLQF